MSQFTTVTGTVKDLTGRAYQEGTFSVNFVDPGTSGQIASLSNGQPFQTSFSGSLDSFGFFSVTVADNGQIAAASGEANTKWQFIMAANNNVLNLPAGVPVPTFSYTTTINCSTNTPSVCTSGTLDISAQLQLASALLPFGTVTLFAGAPTGACVASQLAVDTTTGNFYDCVAATWQKVGPGTGALSSPVTSPNPIAFDVNVNFKGPNPYVDVTRYGVRGPCTTAAPCGPGVTTTINSGSASATISSASIFVNGDGVTIFGAGAAHAMTTPVISAVTPANAGGPTVTGTVVAAPAQATTYNYKIVARNTSQGLTAASATVSTTTGAATLGYSTVAVTSQSRSATTATVTTSAPHAISVGTVVQISQATDGSEFSGYFVVATVPDNTHFTYNNGVDAGGPVISTTSTGGTAAWFECNHITWSSVTGAFEYIIYCDRASPGTFAPIGISRPGDLYWDDFGSPMMDGILMPYFVPSTPPVAASSNSLTTTILSGAGTTSLTLNANAGTSVSGATILFDNAPNFAAVVAANGNAGTLYFPAGSAYVFNSYTTTNANVSLGGQLWLNDTLQIQGKWNGGLTPTGLLPPQFSLTSANFVYVNRANPGFYGPNFNSGNLTDLQFLPQGKSGRAVLLSSASALYQRLVCSLQSNDYTGVCLELNSALPGSSGSFFNTIRDSTFVGNQGIHTQTPILAFTHSNGFTQLENTSLSGAGIQFDGVELYMKGGRDQGGEMPVLQLTAASNATVRIENFDEDTMAQPLVASLGGASSVYVFDAGNPSFDGVSAPPLLTGLPYNYKASPFSISGNSPFTTSGYGGIKATSGTPLVNSGQGSSASIGFQMPNNGTPTVSISGATGRAAGTYYYALEAVDALGSATLSGNPAAPITVNGSQGVLVTFPTPASGQVAWNLCITTNLATGFACAQGGTAGSGFQVPIGNLTYLDANTLSATNSQFGNFAASAWVSKTGVGGQTLTLTPTFFANLGTPANGTFYFCPDCTVANPCVGSGTGALAKRLNGVWVCN